VHGGEGDHIILKLPDRAAKQSKEKEEDKEEDMEEDEDENKLVIENDV